MESEPMTIQRENPVYRRFRGGSNQWCCIAQDSKPNPLPTELFWPCFTGAITDVDNHSGKWWKEVREGGGWVGIYLYSALWHDELFRWQRWEQHSTIAIQGTDPTITSLGQLVQGCLDHFATGTHAVLSKWPIPYMWIHSYEYLVDVLYGLIH